MTAPQYPRLTEETLQACKETLARLEEYDAHMMQSHDRWATTQQHREYALRIQNLKAALRRHEEGE